MFDIRSLLQVTVHTTSHVPLKSKTLFIYDIYVSDIRASETEQLTFRVV